MKRWRRELSDVLDVLIINIGYGALVGVLLAIATAGALWRKL
jgi:hypothetical protein